MANKKSLYLKFRPVQLNEIVGQKYVIQTLTQAAKRNQFAHAYLFSGNHGCGKTSTARIVATLMTCEAVSDGVVCGKCRACNTIHRGASMDVKELDGAANRGIDNIKTLIESAQWSPVELSRKIYIIDECHQLTKEATSALLKIIEEPPPYLTFILCTTDVHKILPTILSRCQRFNFGKISSKEIAQQLTFIAKEEGIFVEEAGIDLLAKISRGSMRDAIGVLEQIGTAANSKKISAASIQKYFGTSDRLGITNIVQSILEGRVALLMDQINDMVIASVEAKHIMFEVSEAFRNIMLLKIQNGQPNSLVDLPDSEMDTLRTIGKNLKMSQLVRLAQLFSDVEKKMSFNINERWIMEATLINCIASLRKEMV